MGDLWLDWSTTHVKRGRGETRVDGRLDWWEYIEEEVRMGRRCCGHVHLSSSGSAGRQHH